jgi:hypothetical protein
MQAILVSIASAFASQSRNVLLAVVERRPCVENPQRRNLSSGDLVDGGGLPQFDRSIAFVGRLTADGEGTFCGVDTISREGVILHRTYTATYTVNPDCTGSYEADTSLGVVHADFAIIGNGEEVRNIRTDEGQVLTFQLKKQ